jgi:hypothetical protein
VILDLIRGDDRVRDVTVTRAGAALSLATAQAITFTAKRQVADPDADAVIVKTLGAGIEVDGTTPNVAHVTFDAADTDALEAPALFPFDVEIIDADGKRETVAIGWLRLTADVTREAPTGS